MDSLSVPDSRKRNSIESAEIVCLRNENENLTKTMRAMELKLRCIESVLSLPENKFISIVRRHSSEQRM